MLNDVSLSRSRLLVNVEDLAALDSQVIEEKATLVDNIVRTTDCEGVKDIVRVYEYFINDNGKETRETAELITQQVDITEQDVVSQNETWITTKIILRPDLNCLNHDDDTLITTLKSDYLHHPSLEEYNTTMIPSTIPQYSSQYGQDSFLDKFIFKGQLKKGFFIEAGADDFVDGSNTLWFEMEHQWTGVLVEPNPARYPKGFLANRKAWGAPFCLGILPRPHFNPFTLQTVQSGMSGLIPKHVKDDLVQGTSYNLQCFPLYSLLLAVDNPTINFFSLDIEGAEFLVLQSIPWDKVDIEVMVVELHLAGKVFPGTREEVHRFIADKKFDYVGTVGVDDIFVRADLNQGKYKFDREMALKFESYFYDKYQGYRDFDEL